jgi:hypothetical protein
LPESLRIPTDRALPHPFSIATGQLIALAMLLVFLSLQAVTLSYGVTVNDIDWIRNHKTAPPDGAATPLNKLALVDRESDRAEDADRWALRFKLYSVEADEVVPIMALARIRSSEGRLNPGFYQNGGVLLYSLGGWYFTLAKMGVVPLAPLETLLREPQRMDAVYIWGRAFVLLAVTVAGALLYAALAQIAPPTMALLGLSIFLFCPATIQFSQIIKPHWFALLWINAAILIVATTIRRQQMNRSSEIALGVVLGLAVGTVSLAATFAGLIWLILVGFVWSGAVRRVALLSIPAIAIGVWLLTNPYLLLDPAAVATERAMLADWFAPRFSAAPVADFFIRSLVPGFGVALTALLLVIASAEILRPSFAGAPAIVMSALLPIIPVACLMASMIQWHVSYRYTPYLLPLTVVLVARSRWCSPALLGFVALLTALQAVPLKIAYLDENDPGHSTRLRTARWIDQSIPAGHGVCLGTSTPAPYDTPPFDLTRYRVNEPDCTYVVRVEREMDLATVPENFILVERFRPRFTPVIPQLVFGHINPQISVYHRE